MSGASPLAILRRNKLGLFALAGLAAGAVGALLAEPLQYVGPFGRTPVGLVLKVAAWSGVFTACIAVALSWAGRFYNRREEESPVRAALGVIRSVVFGSLCGAIAGAVAQTCFMVVDASDLVRDILVRPACWGLLGLLLGLLLTAVIPNLGTIRAVAGGLAGGVVGGFGFLAVTFLVPHQLHLLARMGGVGVLGAALGFAIVAVETLFRQASLEVIWAPNETTTFTLGPKPVYIGGGDDHVFIAGLEQHHAGITFIKGKVEYTELASGKRTPLKDGSRLDIGKLAVVVHAKS